MPVQKIHDAEFGEMRVQRSARAAAIRIRVDTSGQYLITAPNRTPLVFIRLTINASRDALRRLWEQRTHGDHYQDGETIGRQHRLVVVPTSMVQQPTLKIERQRLIVMLPPERTLDESDVQQAVRGGVARVLRKEAKALLPKRLAGMAELHHFDYRSVRFSHSSGRWGSCSTTGTISLNIALMKLPDRLIDYVLAHELSHTRQMNHSAAFWKEVAGVDPLYKVHRQQLKRESPIV